MQRFPNLTRNKFSHEPNKKPTADLIVVPVRQSLIAVYTGTMRPPPERFNIARYCLAGRAAAHPDKTALIIVGGEGKERAWSYRELDLAVRRLAGGLRHMGLAAGERLMIRMDNDLGYVLSFFAALAAGLVALPSSAALTGEEAEFLLEDSAAAALALADGLALAHQPAHPTCGCWTPR